MKSTPDDSFVPWVLGTGGRPAIDAAREKPVGEGLPDKSRNEDDLGDNWHAEVEVLAPWPEHTKDVEVDAQASAFDATANEARDSPQSQSNVRNIVEDSNPGPPETSQKSRTENRLERKARREAAGQYKSAAKAGLGEAESGAESTQTVLEKIEAMDGVGKAEIRGPRPMRARVRTAKAGKLTHHEETKKFRSGGKEKPVEPKAPKIKVEREDWQIQKHALEAKFGEQGWQPRKRLSPDTLDGIRALHTSNPAAYSTNILAQHFKVTPEAIRRVLKSKWRPNEEEIESRRQRWEKRGVKKWKAMAEEGMRPPSKWRALGVKNPYSQAEKRSMPKDDYVPWEGESATTKLGEKSGTPDSAHWDQESGVHENLVVRIV